MGLLLMVPWVGLQGVIVVFPDYTHLLFCSFCVIMFKKYQLEDNALCTLVIFWGCVLTCL